MTIPRTAVTATSSYEVWVRRLRQWQRDPATPLHDLPVLEHGTFTPITYQRLMTHIEKALEAVTKRWSERLAAAFSHSSSGHELARDLVTLRPLLARRVQLAHHPHLPPALRDVLGRECIETLSKMQTELEEDLKRLGRDGRLSRTDVDTLLTTVRENSLLRVMEMDIPQDGTIPSPRAVAPSFTTRSTGRGGEYG